MKKILVLILAFGFLTGFTGIKPVYGATLEEQLRDINQQIKDTQNAVNSQKKQVKTIQDMVDSVNSQVAVTQTQINLSNQKINLTNQQISETQVQIDQKQKELDLKKADLYETIRNYYESGTPSTVEIIASSNSLSDMINQSQYTEALSNQIDEQANQITQAKTTLETQKTALETQKTDLENQKTDLENQKRNLDIQNAEKNRLLAQAKGQQSQLQASLNQAYADKDNVSAAIYAARKAAGGYTGGGTGGYPYANSDTNGVDPWGFYNRQCTSYAAWYFNEVEGKSWYNTRPGSGSAWNWPALAADQGYSVSSTPRVGAIVSWDRGGMFGSYGHVAIVESVNSNGTFNLSEYNWIPYSYSERSNVSTAGARFIY